MAILNTMIFVTLLKTYTYINISYFSGTLYVEVD